jgi:hypothetical protein
MPRKPITLSSFIQEFNTAWINNLVSFKALINSLADSPIKLIYIDEEITVGCIERLDQKSSSN